MNLKRIVSAVLGSAPAMHAGLWRRRRGAIILAWHNVIPVGTVRLGDGSLHLDFDRFRRQLDAVPHQFRIVPLNNLLHAPADEGPRCVLTFDDAYAGALGLALPELARRGWPATMFVAPGLLGAEAPWWDAYADPENGLPPHFREAALGEGEGRDRSIRALADRFGLPRRPEHPAYRLGSVDELAVAAQLPGITLGAHGWSHANLGRVLTDAEVADEIDRPLRWLETRFPGQAIRWFAWPYGRTHPSGIAAAATRYDGVVEIDGDWLGPKVAAARVPRLNVPSGMEPAVFRARLSGWW